ncbi:hypothetical protein [Streptomyces sp. NPDC055210]
MSDENEFVYRNENTGDIARYPYRSPRLEMLPNWVTLQDPEADVEPEPPHTPPAPETPPSDPGAQEPTGPAEPQTPAPTAPADVPSTEPVPGGNGDEPEPVERPTRSATKADWLAYARTRAKDSDEEATIDGLTKEQLVEQYGGDS